MDEPALLDIVEPILCSRQCDTKYLRQLRELDSPILHQLLQYDQVTLVKLGGLDRHRPTSTSLVRLSLGSICKPLQPGIPPEPPLPKLRIIIIEIGSHRILFTGPIDPIILCNPRNRQMIKVLLKILAIRRRHGMNRKVSIRLTHAPCNPKPITRDLQSLTSQSVHSRHRSHVNDRSGQPELRKVRLSPRRQQAPILQLRNSRVRCRILETSYLSNLLEVPGSVLLHCVNDLHVHFVEL